MTLALIESIPKSRSFNWYSVWRKIIKHSVIMIKKVKKTLEKKPWPRLDVLQKHKTKTWNLTEIKFSQYDLDPKTLAWNWSFLESKRREYDSLMPESNLDVKFSFAISHESSYSSPEDLKNVS